MEAQPRLEPDELRSRLESFIFDPPAAPFPFVARLARENQWPIVHAGRVVREYLRFLYVAMRAGHPVSPSEAVDQTWHLHLLYTRSYWDDLCTGVLGRPFHHEPTTGGRAETAKFDDWYARTLDSYQTLLGEVPPPDIWPSPQARKKAAAPAAWVSSAHYWVLPKPSTLLRRLFSRRAAP